MIEDINFEEMRHLTRFLNNLGIFSTDDYVFVDIIEVSISTDGYFIKLDKDGEQFSIYLPDVPATRQELVDTFFLYNLLLIPSDYIPSYYQLDEEDEDEEQEEEQYVCPDCEEEEKSKEFAEFVAFVTAFSKVMNK